MIPDDMVEEVRAAADIVDVIGEFVQLKKAGREYKANCPFHEERTPSFYVVPAKGFYKCFGCGKSGDVFSFVMERQGLDFVEAVKHVAGRAGVQVREVKRSQEEEDPNTLHLYEVYRDEAALEAHRQAPHYTRWRDTVRDWFAEPPSRLTLVNVFPTDDAWK